MTDRIVEPLDPRKTSCPKECDAAWGVIGEEPSPICFNNPSFFDCKRCGNTGRVPLHPTPTVEVYVPEWSPPGSWAYNIYEQRFSYGPYDTPDEALRAARLAWLGAELRGIKRVYVFSKLNDKPAPFGSGIYETIDAAIEAAFAAKEKSNAD